MLHEKQSYELFYSWGGHGGPYYTLALARMAARRILESNKRPGPASISIVERTAQGVSGYGNIVEKVQREEYHASV